MKIDHLYQTGEFPQVGDIVKVISVPMRLLSKLHYTENQIVLFNRVLMFNEFRVNKNFIYYINEIPSVQLSHLNEQIFLLLEHEHPGLMWDFGIPPNYLRLVTENK